MDIVVVSGFILIDGILSKEARSMYEILMERILDRDQGLLLGEPAQYPA